jgi:predicted P-loop ATPase
MITLLFCAPGYVATKTFDETLPGGVKAYDLGYKFEWAEVECQGIVDLGRIVESASQSPSVVMIRGKVLPGSPEWIRRAMKPKPGKPAYIEPTENDWVMWDFDKTTIPYDPNDPEASARALVDMFPEGLKEASFVWQSSSSQHKHSTFRGHIFQYLDRPYTDQELKYYAKRMPFGPDRSVFNAVQPHYVAAPIFATGVDPIPTRMGYVEGLKPWGTVQGQETNRLKEQALALLDKACREIKAIKQGEARHPVVNRASYSLGQLSPHLLSEHEIFNRLQEACLTGKDPMPLDRIIDEVRRGIEDGKKTPKLAGEAWKAHLEYEGKDFKVSGTPTNATIVLSNDSRWNGVLGLNDRAQQIVLLKSPPVPEHLAGPPAPRDWIAGSDGTRTAAWFAQEYRCRIHAKDINAAVEAVAEENRYDPVKDWLEDLEWDGTARLDTIARDYLGAVESYEWQIFTKFCLNAVARAYEPGCKSQYTMVLEGVEEIGKSDFLEALAGRAWYASVQVDLSSKDAVQYIHGPWISDFSEIASFKKTSQVEALKDFLSRPYDRVRLPYKPNVVDLPRRGVFAATTNEKVYLASRTGNRRFRPIYCHGISTPERPKAHIPLMTPGVREQVWAEARYRYLAGEDTWQIQDAASLKLAQSERELDRFDAWHEVVERWLKRVEQSTVSEILELALAMPAERQDNRAQQRVIRILQDLSWIRSRTSSGRLWRAPPGWVHGLAQDHASIVAPN